MTVHQVKPEYMRIVAAIPHSVKDAHYWQWQDDPAVKAWRDRWTDWFTDELFGIEMDGVTVVKSKMSRLDCDAERLEGEPDRLANFVRIGDTRLASWEAIKASIVRYTAERYGVARPSDLADTEAVAKLRSTMEGDWRGPSWIRSAAWKKLANAMLESVFARVDVTLPHDAFVQHYMGWRHMPESWQSRVFLHFQSRK